MVRRTHGYRVCCHSKVGVKVRNQGLRSLQEYVEVREVLLRGLYPFEQPLITGPRSNLLI
jgi:hypothetical protein